MEDAAETAAIAAIVGRGPVVGRIGVAVVGLAAYIVIGAAKDERVQYASVRASELSRRVQEEEIAGTTR